MSRTGDEILTYAYEAARLPETVTTVGGDDSTLSVIAGAASSVAAGLLQARSVVIYDGTDDLMRRCAVAFAERYARLPSADHARYVLGVSDWDGFRRQLGTFASIDRLYVCAHGSPTSLKIGATKKSLRDLDDVFGADTPTVRQISFEGCNLAFGLQLMVPVAQTLGAREVQGWNRFWGYGIQPVAIEPDLDAAARREVAELYRHLDRYFIRSSVNSTAIAAMAPGSYEFAFEFFSTRENIGPPPAGTPDLVDWAPRSYQKRSVVTPDTALQGAVAQALARTRGLVRVILKMPQSTRP
ncbi:MAG: hypothetical protein AAF962_16500 [Actinomycetota bacterium]